MKKLTYTAAVITAALITGCGGDDTTYSTNGTLPSDTPTEAPALLIQGSDGASAVMSYTTLEDGSVLITCGDGDNYSCGVMLAEPTDTDDVNETEDAK